MYKFRITFRDETSGKKKPCIVKARGIVPAIEEAIRKMMLFGWDIIEAKLIG